MTEQTTSWAGSWKLRQPKEAMTRMKTGRSQVMMNIFPSSVSSVENPLLTLLLLSVNTISARSVLLIILKKADVVMCVQKILEESSVLLQK